MWYDIRQVLFELNYKYFFTQPFMPKHEYSLDQPFLAKHEYYLGTTIPYVNMSIP